MRTGSSSDTDFRGHRSQSHVGARLRKTRKSRDFRFDLEGLELRTLLSTLPAATLTTSSPINLSQDVLTGPNAKEDSPLVEIDPLDPQKMVAVWVNNDTIDIPFPRASGARRCRVYAQWRSNVGNVLPGPAFP